MCKQRLTASVRRAMAFARKWPAPPPGANLRMVSPKAFLAFSNSHSFSPSFLTYSSPRNTQHGAFYKEVLCIALRHTRLAAHQEQAEPDLAAFHA